MYTLRLYRYPSAYPALLAGLLALSFLAITAPSRADAPFAETAGGMQYRQVVEGDGEPIAMGQVAHIHLVGWIDDHGQKGRELYNSRRGGKTKSFVVGTDGVIPAFNEGVLGMKAGGRRLLMVPPAFAYGSRGVDEAIPPDTSLIFLIDLVAIGRP